MPRDVNVQFRDGSTHQYVGVPDGVSNEAVIAKATNDFGQPPDKIDGAFAGPDPTGSFAENVDIGFGKAFSDLGTGLKQLGLAAADQIPGVDLTQRRADLRTKIDEQKRLDEPLMRTGGGITGNVGGVIASMLAPFGVLGVGAKGAQIAGNANTANRLMQLSRATTIPNTVRAATAQGAAYGAATPTGTGDNPYLPTMIGGGLGAFGQALPMGLGLITRGVHGAVLPFSNEGAEKIAARTFGRFAGDSGSFQNMSGEMVPGSMPTIAEATEDPGVAILQRQLSDRDPQFAAALTERGEANNLARLNVLEGIAGTPEELAAARALREDTADVTYNRAMAADQMRRDLARTEATERAAVSTGEALPAMELATPGLRELTSSPTFRQAVEKAKTLAADKLVPIGDPLSNLTGLHYTKLALDQMVNEGKRSGSFGNTSEEALIGLKERLLAEIDKVSPQYGTAKTVFQQQSGPVNRMEVGGEILRRATGGMTALENPMVRLNPLAKMLSDIDAVAAGATDFRGAQGAQILGPENMNALTMVLRDLERAGALNKGTARGSNTRQNFAMQNLLDQLAVPFGSTGERLTQSGVADALATTLGKIYGVSGREQAIQSIMQRMSLEPEYAREVLSRVPPAQRAMVERQIAQFLSPGLVATQRSVDPVLEAR